MSSSTSSSETRSWLRLAAITVAVALAGLCAVIGTAVALDVYDTGRFALLRYPGVPEQGPRTANASRGRDQAFDSAIIGNSHTQPLSPERLAAATGAAFVSLATPATMPPHHMLMLQYFRAHRGAIRALVIGTDMHYCAPDTAFANARPFPNWLYTDSDLDYVRGLVRLDTAEKIVERVRYVYGLERRARPDGFFDDSEYQMQRARGRVDLDRPLDLTVKNPTGRYPVLDVLRENLAVLPAETAVVLLRPPIFISSVPRPGTEQERQERDCVAALRTLAAARPRTVVVEWPTDRPEIADKGNFIDHSHYNQAVAKLIEADLAKALADLGVRPGS